MSSEPKVGKVWECVCPDPGMQRSSRVVAYDAQGAANTFVRMWGKMELDPQVFAVLVWPMGTDRAQTAEKWNGLLPALPPPAPSAKKSPKIRWRVRPSSIISRGKLIHYAETAEDAARAWMLDLHGRNSPFRGANVWVWLEGRDEATTAVEYGVEVMMGKSRVIRIDEIDFDSPGPDYGEWQEAREIRCE